MNLQQNQVYMPKQTIKNSDFQQSSWFAIGRKYKLARRKCSKSAFILMDEIFDFFSTETGKRNGYKILNVAQLSKELELSKNSIYTALEEINSNEIYIVLKDKKHNYIVLPITEESQELKRLITLGEIEVSFEKGKFDYKKTSITNINPSQNIEKVIQFSKSLSQNTENENSICSQEIENGSQNTEKASQNTENGSQKIENTKNATNYIVSDLEGVSKKSQESYKETLLKNPLKESSLDHLGSSKENKTEIEILAKKNDDDFLEKDDKKKIELFFPIAPEVEAEKQKEQEAYKKRFEELKRKLEAEKIKRDSEPKEIIVRNEQTDVQNINNDETLENEKKVARIENLTEKQQELRAFLIKDLEIDNPNFFFEYLNKIDVDNFTNSANKLKEIIDNGKQINDKVSFLKKMIDNKLEKMNQESNGYNNSSNEYKINKKWENLFRYLTTKKLINGKVVCGTSLIDDVRNLNLNQDMFGIYIHELYFYGIITNNARKDLENQLFEVLKIASQWITVQEYQDLIEWNSSTKHYARELIELFRGVL